MSQLTLELDLDGDLRTLTLPISPAPSFDDFLVQLDNVYQLTTRDDLGRVTAFEYDDEEDDLVLVSLPEEFADFIHSAGDGAFPSTLHLHVTHAHDKGGDRSDEVKELLAKVKQAVEKDPSLAHDLREIVHQVCGDSPRHHGHHHDRPDSSRGGRGRGRGRGGPPGRGRGRGRGTHYHRGWERGPSHPRHGRGEHECHHEFPPFPPSPHEPECLHPPFPHHPAGPHPPPPMWNVERVIREHWSPIPLRGPNSPFPPPPPGPPGPPPPRPHFYGPMDHGAEHVYREPPRGSGRNCSGFRTHLPPPPFFAQPPRHAHPHGHRDILPNGCHHRCNANANEDDQAREDGWDFGFEELRV